MAAAVMAIKIFSFLLIASCCCFLQASETMADDHNHQNLTMIEPSSFEQGWAELQEAFNKATELAEGIHHHRFTADEYMRYYTIVYKLSTEQKRGDLNGAQFYEGYKKFFEEYSGSKVLPLLQEKRDEDLLHELVRMWSNYKTMTKWLSRFFGYLNRYYIPRKALPSLTETSYLSFYYQVYGKMHIQVRNMIISMINREREGGQIDRALVTNMLNIYVEMAEGSMKFYEENFVDAKFRDAAAFYFRRKPTEEQVLPSSNYSSVDNAGLQKSL
ncbi:hypothetical protein Ancab_030561 [Ancistrocladus abbreviatus]